MHRQESQKVAEGLATAQPVKRARESLKEELEWWVALKRRPRVYI